MTTALYGTEIKLPAYLQEQYRLTPDSSVRIIETRDGILLVPLTSEPMDDELVSEIREWQELGAESLADFPYETESQP